MKQSIFFILLLFTFQAALGQNWQPIYLNETLNYQSSANPDEPIGVFASDLSENADSSDVRLVLDSDTLDECGCETMCFLIKADFLQSKIAYLDNGIVAFQNPDTFYIYTEANLGEAWVVKNNDAGNEIIATVTSILLTDVLGEADSLKIISLSNEEELHLSKHHGITKWTSLNDTLVLTSIPKRGLGDVYLTKAEVYNFNVGDVFWYAMDENYADINDGVNFDIQKRRSVKRFEVLSLTSNDSLIEIDFLYNSVTHFFSHYNNNYPPNQNFGSYQDTINIEIDLTVHEFFYELPFNKYWHQGAYYISQDGYLILSDLTNFDEYIPAQYAFRKNKGVFNNHKILSYGMNGYTFQFSDQASLVNVLDFEVQLEMIPDFVSHCSWPEDYTIWPGDGVSISYPYSNTYEGETGSIIVGEGLGLVAYFYTTYPGIEVVAETNAVLIGYKKGEEVVGYIPEIGVIMSVSEPEIRNQIKFSFYPNPASNSINVALRTSDVGQLRILDISGRVVYTRQINSEELEIDTGQFPSGIYFIYVETQNGIGIEKVIISR